MGSERTAIRTCPLCEATCGLELTMTGRELVEVRGDEADVFSHGYLCPKAIALVDLERDPDRIRTPLVRSNGELRSSTWEEAFARIEAGLKPILEQDRNAVAAYVGNPNAHNLSFGLYGRVFLKALGSINIYTASTVDQMPKHVSAGLMFGTALSIPVPDVDRTDYLLVLGANPLASNGSLLTAPDIPGRLRALKKRGGKLVVVDPRRSVTARTATEHLFIVPGTDALFLFGLVHELIEENIASPGRLAEHLNGLDDVRALAKPFTPEAVASVCGIPAADIRRIARELVAAKTAAVYGRIGTTTQEFGTLTSWLVDVVNVLTGNLDRPGGAMFTTPAAGSGNTAGTPGVGKGVTIGRRRSRVRGLPEVFGELPAACMAEEMLTPGEGQIKALITVAGNPCVSTPDATRLTQAIEGLDFMVSVDIYVNETTRHADVILPGESVLEKPHYDLGLYNLACRNVANYSPPVHELAEGSMAEWEVLLRLAAIATGQGANSDVAALDEMVAREVLRRGVTNPSSPANGVEEEKAWTALGARRGPERLLDILLRSGPYGDAFGRNTGGLSLDVLVANPSGVDLGPLVERIPEVLRTASGKIEMAPAAIAADVPRLQAALARKRNGGMVLVGRRQLRSNNSWMHNLPTLAGGSNRCTMHINPSDASRLGIADGAQARVASEAGTILVEAEVTEDVMPGVISIPHGWGHDDERVRASVASKDPGANSNVLAPAMVDPLSGNAVLNGIPVTVEPT